MTIYADADAPLILHGNEVDEPPARFVAEPDGLTGFYAYPNDWIPFTTVRGVLKFDPSRVA